MPPSVLDSPQAAPAALRGGAIRTAGYALGVLLGLVSAPVLLHHLGVEGFGRYATVTVLIGMLGTGTEAGLAAIALREYATHSGEERVLAMRHLLGIRLAVTGAGVFGALVFGLAAGYDDVLLVGIVVAGAGVVCVMVQSLLAVPLQATLRNGRATALVLTRQAIAAGAIVALALAGATLGWFFLAGTVAAAVALAATVLVVRSEMPLRPTWDVRAWGDLLRTSIPYAIATAIYAVYFRVGIIVLSLRAPALETGLYATSYRIVEVVLIIPGILVTTAFPILARAERADAVRFERATARLVELSVVVGAAAMVAIELSAPLIIDFLAPAEGEPAVAVLRLQAPAVLAAFVAVACTYPLLARRRQKGILAANAIAFAAVVGLTVALVGDEDAARRVAAVTTATEFLLCAVIASLLRREVPGLARVARSAWPVLVAVAAALAVLAVPGLPPAADTAAGLAAFAAVLAATGRLPAELAHLRSRG